MAALAVIATINCRNRKFPARFMVRKRKGVKPDVVCYQEMERRLHFLDTKFPAYRMYVGIGSADDRRGSRTNPVHQKKSLRMIMQMSIKAADKASPHKLAPERYLTVTGFWKKGVGRVAVINVHNHAAIKNKGTDIKRVREAAKMVGLIEEVMDFLTWCGFEVIVAGDGNFPAHAKSPDWMDIHEMLNKHGYNVVKRGVDLIGIPPRLEVVWVKKFSRARTRSDHPGIVVAAKRK